MARQARAPSQSARTERLKQIKLLGQLVLLLHELRDQLGLLGLRAELLAVLLPFSTVRVVHYLANSLHSGVLLLFLSVDTVDAIRK